MFFQKIIAIRDDDSTSQNIEFFDRIKDRVGVMSDTVLVVSLKLKIQPIFQPMK